MLHEALAVEISDINTPAMLDYKVTDCSHSTFTTDVVKYQVISLYDTTVGTGRLSICVYHGYLAVVTYRLEFIWLCLPKVALLIPCDQNCSLICPATYAKWLSHMYYP